MSEQIPPAGWYPAPHAGNEQRYWDGTKWIDVAAPPAAYGATTEPSGPAASPVQAAAPARSKATVWLIAGGVAALVVLITVIVVQFSALTPPAADTVVTSSPQPTPEPEETSASEPSMSASPESDQPAPSEEETAPLTTAQENAIREARDYLDFSGFSRDRLIDQLEYEGYSTEDSTFGADNAGADWNAEAAETARQYLDYSSFSRQELADQLVYEGFTPEQVEFGLAAVGY